MTAILAFAPLVGWLGNPAWWRETLPRLAHYYTLNVGRQGALPDISIMYFGEIYEFTLPWHNGWVLIAITVPLAILATAAHRRRLGTHTNRPRPVAALLLDPLSHLSDHPHVSHAGA